MAESVYEVADLQLKEEYKKAKEAVDAETAALAAMEEQAADHRPTGSRAADDDADEFAQPMGGDPRAGVRGPQGRGASATWRLNKLKLPGMFVGTTSTCRPP